MLIKDKLVQNYYELHGSFDGISLSAIGSFIEDSDSLIDECYQILGYSSKEEHDIRMAYRRGSLDSSYLEKCDITVPQLSELETNVRNAKYIAMLAEYFKMQNGIMVKFNGTIYSLDKFIFGLRYTTKKIRDYAKAIVAETETPLITFKQGDKNEIANGIFTVTNKLTAAGQKEIIIKAIIKASGALDKTLPATIVKHPELIPLLAFTDREAYLNALETAEERGITYKDLMLENGYKIYDYSGVYQYAKCIPITIVNSVYIMTDESTIDEPYTTVVDVADLTMTLQALAIGGMSCNM